MKSRINAEYASVIVTLSGGKIADLAAKAHDIAAECWRNGLGLGRELDVRIMRNADASNSPITYSACVLDLKQSEIPEVKRLLEDLVPKLVGG